MLLRGRTINGRRHDVTFFLGVPEVGFERFRAMLTYCAHCFGLFQRPLDCAVQVPAFYRRKVLGIVAVLDVVDGDNCLFDVREFGDCASEMVDKLLVFQLSE